MNIKLRKGNKERRHKNGDNPHMHTNTHKKPSTINKSTALSTNEQKSSTNLASVMTARSLLKEDSECSTMEVRNQKFRSNYLLIMNMCVVQFLSVWINQQ